MIVGLGAIVLSVWSVYYLNNSNENLDSQIKEMREINYQTKQRTGYNAFNDPNFLRKYEGLLERRASIP